MAKRSTAAAILPWAFRILIAVAILAAPVIIYWAFTDEETPDPTRKQRLGEVNEHNRPPNKPRDPRPDPRDVINQQP